MNFPWHKYTEKVLSRRNTLQVFVTNSCNLACAGCFAKNVMQECKGHISVEEYTSAIKDFIKKGGRQVNLLGGEPLIHPKLKDLIQINNAQGLKTTIYTNGTLLDRFKTEDFCGAKLRVSIYSLEGNKGAYNIPRTDIKFDANFMVSRRTTLDEICECAEYVEKNYDSDVFFIFSMRELDNPEQEFFYDTKDCMPNLEYKRLVHDFLSRYNGNMDIHISKRGVFESTTTLPDNQCRFANYFVGGKIIQCPYDVANLKFQPDYEFGERFCQQNNSCLMSKIVLQKKE
jgi:organic radical activating enzyme